MRRRPIEFWWISAFAIFQALLTWHSLELAGATDRPWLLGYGAAFLLSALLLMCFSPLGRWGSLVLLGVAACHEAALLAAPLPAWWVRVPAGLILFAFCLWMIFYLGNASTGRLCRGVFRAPRAALADISFCDLFELALGAGAGYLAARLGAETRLAGCVGIFFYVAYGLLLEDWLRRRWRTVFVRVERGFPKADAGRWKTACRALARQDFVAAACALNGTSLEAREHPAGRLLLRVVEWQELLGQVPADGRACLRRVAFEHDWQPHLLDRNRLLEYIESAPVAEIYELLDARTELIRGLIAAGLNERSVFREKADGYLARIVGETFQFNAPECWAAWWEASGEQDWSGDGGAVSLVVRLLRNDADAAAHKLAYRIAGRAEEPLLKELTGQVCFLNAMQKAMREHKTVDAFVKQPQRMLLVPELADAMGLLHADSHWVQSMGLPLPVVARRMNLRVPLVDYIGRVWDRYPHELGGDMPWVLKTLTDKNLGVLRARSRFKAWWPVARESFVRHDRAVAAGLAAYKDGADVLAEEAFRKALAEQPRELSSRYNLALCLIRRQAHAEAARLIRELTRLEPKESFWWLVLGEMLRNVNRSSDAHAAFRRAQELGAAAPKVAFYRGLTFGRDQRDADAIQQLDCVLGHNPAPAKIDALVSALETEGLWKLAGHYREKSFERGLSGGDDRCEPDGIEDVSA